MFVGELLELLDKVLVEVFYDVNVRLKTQFS